MPRRSRTRHAEEAAAAAPAEDAEEQARPATRQRTGDDGGNDNGGGVDAAGGVGGVDGEGGQQQQRQGGGNQALADHSRLLQDGGRRAQAHARAVARAAEKFGLWAWQEINLPNLRDNILPTRSRADLILRKGPSHAIEEVDLRRV